MKYLIIIDSSDISKIKIIGGHNNLQVALDEFEFYRNTYFGQNVRFAEVTE